MRPGDKFNVRECYTLAVRLAAIKQTRYHARLCKTLLLLQLLLRVCSALLTLTHTHTHTHTHTPTPTPQRTHLALVHQVVGADRELEQAAAHHRSGAQVVEVAGQDRREHTVAVTGNQRHVVGVDVSRVRGDAAATAVPEYERGRLREARAPRDALEDRRFEEVEPRVPLRVPLERLVELSGRARFRVERLRSRLQLWRLRVQGLEPRFQGSG